MSRTFSLGTFSVAGCPPFAGVIVDGRVVAVTALQSLSEAAAGPLSGPETVFGLLQAWERNFPILQAGVAALDLAGAHALESLDIGAIKVHAPVLYPRQIFCAGANYRQHVIDLAVAQGHGANDTMSLGERRAQAERMMDARIASGSPYVFTKSHRPSPGHTIQLSCQRIALSPTGSWSLASLSGGPHDMCRARRRSTTSPATLSSTT